MPRFAQVTGTRRGANRSGEEVAMTDLDRARTLAPFVAGALIGPDHLDSAIALNHTAASMDLEPLHGRFVADADCTEEVSLTLLRSRVEHSLASSSSPPTARRGSSGPTGPDNLVAADARDSVMPKSGPSPEAEG
jgi:hypothetical protein